VSEMNSPTSGGSDLWYSITLLQLPAVVWMRVVYTDATSVLFQYSADGIHWKSIASAFNISAFVTPNSVGFFVNPNSGAWDCDMAVLS